MYTKMCWSMTGNIVEEKVQLNSICVEYGVRVKGSPKIYEPEEGRLRAGRMHKQEWYPQKTGEAIQGF